MMARTRFFQEKARYKETHKSNVKPEAGRLSDLAKDRKELERQKDANMQAFYRPQLKSSRSSDRCSSLEAIKIKLLAIRKEKLKELQIIKDLCGKFLKLTSAGRYCIFSEGQLRHRIKAANKQIRHTLSDMAESEAKDKAIQESRRQVGLMLRPK